MGKPMVDAGTDQEKRVKPSTTVKETAGEIYREAEQKLYRRTDLLFGVLFVVQFIGVVVAALVLTPRTWSGAESSVHVHVWAGIGLGGLLCVMPLLLIVFQR